MWNTRGCHSDTVVLLHKVEFQSWAFLHPAFKLEEVRSHDKIARSNPDKLYQHSKVPDNKDKYPPLQLLMLFLRSELEEVAPGQSLIL